MAIPFAEPPVQLDGPPLLGAFVVPLIMQMRDKGSKSTLGYRKEDAVKTRLHQSSPNVWSQLLCRMCTAIIVTASLSGCAAERQQHFAEHVFRLQQEVYWAYYCSKQAGYPLTFQSVTIEIQTDVDSSGTVTVPVGVVDLAPGLSVTKGQSISIQFGLAEKGTVPANLLPKGENCPEFKEWQHVKS